MAMRDQMARAKAISETSRPPTRNLSSIVSGQAISLFGDYVAYFTLPFLVVSRTGSPLSLGLVAVFQTLPMILFGVAAGAFLDMVRLRRTLILADIARAVAFGLLALAVAAGVDNTAMVLGVAFVVGSMSVLFDSGLQALLPVVLSGDTLVTANARLTTLRTIAFAIGPAVGGLILTWFGGFAVAFVINAVTFLASAVFLLKVRERRVKTRTTSSEFFESFFEGVTFLWNDRVLKFATVGATIANFLIAPLEHIPILLVATRLTGTIDWPNWLSWITEGEAEVGFFIALQAIIGSAGAIVAPRIAARLSLGRMFVVGLFLLGGGFLVVGSFQTFWVFIAAGVALGGASWVNIALSTLRQERSPNALLGRVIAASRTLAWIGIPLGAAIGGAVAESVDLTPVYIAASAIVIVLGLALMASPLWRHRTNREEPESASSVAGDETHQSVQ